MSQADYADMNTTSPRIEISDALIAPSLSIDKLLSNVDTAIDFVYRQLIEEIKKKSKNGLTTMVINYSDGKTNNNEILLSEINMIQYRKLFHDQYSQKKLRDKFMNIGINCYFDTVTVNKFDIEYSRVTYKTINIKWDKKYTNHNICAIL